MSIPRLGQRSIDGDLLLLQDTQRLTRKRDLEVALRRSEHQGLPGDLPVEVGDIGRESQLPALRETLAANERLPCLEHPAPEGAIVDRGVEADGVGLREPGSGKLGATGRGFAAHASGRPGDLDGGTPQRLALSALRLSGLMRRVCRCELEVVLQRRAPHINQIGGAGLPREQD